MWKATVLSKCLPVQITEQMPYSIFCNVICDITLYEEHDNLRLIHLFAPGWLFGFFWLLSGAYPKRLLLFAQYS